MKQLPRLFVGRTVVCLGTGPSLTRADVELCRGRAGVVAINDAYRWAPWADALYAADLRWWEVHKGAPGFLGMKISIGQHAPRTTERFRQMFPDLIVLPNTGHEGLEFVPPGLRIGRRCGGAHSGYQAINLAMHLGAERVLLLGYDCRPDAKGRRHFFGNHPKGLAQTAPSQYALWARSYDSLMQDAKKRGLQIINCSRETAIRSIPRGVLEQQLDAAVAA